MKKIILLIIIVLFTVSIYAGDDPERVQQVLNNC